MEQPANRGGLKPRLGRPRLGTQAARADFLIAAATQVFLRDGYGSASIDKVASEAGVSTRTIYERFKNKADLLGAVITRLVQRDMDRVLATDELDRLQPAEALAAIGRIITGRLCDPESAALFRICASEAQRFPELAAKMRASVKRRMDEAVGGYLRRQVERGTLRLADPDGAAVLFLQMVCAELQECMLFGSADEVARLDFTAHLQQVVDIFLYGALPRDFAADAVREAAGAADAAGKPGKVGAVAKAVGAADAVAGKAVKVGEVAGAAVTVGAVGKVGGEADAVAGKSGEVGEVAGAVRK
jgi:AcrR family transcriptional regulator